MKVPQYFLCLSFVFLHSSLLAQEASKHRMPIMVSHLSEENKALLRRKAAPKHNIFTRVICFNRVCRGFIGWRKNQRSHRFKGYKDGGKVLRPPLKKTTSKTDSLVIVRNVVSEPIVLPSDTIKEIAPKLFVLDEVLFEKNSAILNAAFTYRLDSLVQIIRASNNVSLIVSGYTDNTGSETYNLTLSKQRALAVADYLIKEVPKIIITAKGFGSAKPVADNNTPAGRQKNRRVEILITER